MVQFGGPKTGTQELQIFSNSFDFFGPEGYFLYPISGTHPGVQLSFRGRDVGPFLGLALEDDGFQSFQQFANAGQQQI